MADISKADLKQEIQAILKDADLDNTTAKKVRLELQEKLECDLTDRKKEVYQLIMKVLNEEGSEEEEEEEPVNKPVKRPAPKPVKKNYNSDEVSEDEVPSEGGGSEYEPDQPVKKTAPKRGGAEKRKDSDGSSGEVWGAEATTKKKKRKNYNSDDDSDYEEPKKKRRGGGGGKNGWTAPIKLSQQLEEIVGGNEMPRHEIVPGKRERTTVKKYQAHIIGSKHDLQSNRTRKSAEKKKNIKKRQSENIRVKAYKLEKKKKMATKPKNKNAVEE